MPKIIVEEIPADGSGQLRGQRQGVRARSNQHDACSLTDCGKIARLIDSSFFSFDLIPSIRQPMMEQIIILKDILHLLCMNSRSRKINKQAGETSNSDDLVVDVSTKKDRARRRQQISSKKRRIRQESSTLKC